MATRAFLSTNVSFDLFGKDLSYMYCHWNIFLLITRMCDQLLIWAEMIYYVVHT